MLFRQFSPAFLLSFICTIPQSLQSAAENPSSATDPFVQLAPLIIGVTCRDGVVLVGAHTSDADEPLLYHQRHQQKQKHADNADSTEEKKAEGMLTDLPKDFGGPFRIQSIHATTDGGGMGAGASAKQATTSSATAILSTGWRADCERVVDTCRSLVEQEIDTFGPPEDNNYFGHMLSKQLSELLAECAVTERKLSCAILVAAPLSSGNVDCGGGLWAVNAIDAYRIRAHCFGGGMIENHPQQTSVANVVNQRLCREDFSKMSRSDVIRRLVAILSKNVGGDESESVPLFSSSVRLEIATVGFSGFSRVKLPSGPSDDSR